MRPFLPAALTVLSALLLPSAGASDPPVTYDVGPYAGVLEEGDSATHTYDNNPTDSPCIALAQPYTVLLAHAPADAVLELSAHGYSKTVTGGAGSVTFWSGVCTAFDIKVTALKAEPAVAYAVHVRAHGAVQVGPGDIIAWS